MVRAFIVGETYCSNCSARMLRNESAWVSDHGSMVLCLECLEGIHNDFGTPPSHCSHEHTLRRLYEIAMGLGATNPAQYLSAIEYEVGRLGVHWFCKAGDCSNRNRYTSGYCGIHDVVLNEGKGVRIGGG